MVICVTMSLQIKDDVERHRADAKTSSRPAMTIQGPKEWQEVRIGDMIVVRNKESLPADVVLLASSQSDGLCYVETSNIDGETNLKLRVSKSVTQKILFDLPDDEKKGKSSYAGASKSADVGIDIDGESKDRSSSEDGETVGRNLSTRTFIAEKSLQKVTSRAALASGIMSYDVPNSSVNTFKGTLRNLEVRGRKSEPLSFSGDQQLLRGSVLRNTSWIIGLVVYTGEDTKVAQNSHEASLKLSNLERVVNSAMKVIFVILAVLILISLSMRAIMRASVFDGKYEEFWYLFPEGDNDDATSDLPWPVAYSFTFLILYTNFVPLTMYITMEIINFAHSVFINRDLKMYDPTTDTCANARSMNLCSELGQIQYIFSDKTGTLTQNVMILKQIWVDGEVYGSLNSYAFDARKVALDVKAGGRKADALVDFMSVMALAHTVVPEKDDVTPSKIVYQAESPDEGALCEGAAASGFVFADRTTSRVCMRGPDGTTKRFDLCAINGFNSTRKRMSVVLRREDGTYILLCKGADNVMLERAAGSTSSQQAIKTQLRLFSEKGLRTLVMGKRELKEAEFQTWMKRYKAATIALDGRKELLAQAAEAIEVNMKVVGASAIEDKLQDGVPETIEDIRKAGIKLWVLTGDKVETAINIGLSCKLLLPEDRGMRTIKMDISREADIIDDFVERSDLMVARKFLSAVRRGDDKIKSPTGKDDNIWRVMAASFRHGTERPYQSIDTISWADIQHAMLGVRVASDLHEIVEEIEVAEGKRAERSSPVVPLVSESGNRRNSRFHLTASHLNSLALVITGPTLQFILGDDADETTSLLLRIAQSCSVVVACRVSPLQKAQLVLMVKEGLEPTPVTLAIGDGANDVSMIKKARVGVGISGREGLQAANAADFSISQFRFLKRLLFVHGRWDYRRLSKVIIYSLHKNFVLALTLFLYNFYTIFSGTSLYDTWLGSGYNSFFLFWSPLAIGFFDKDVHEDAALKIPELYVSGLLQLDLNLFKICEMVVLSVINACIVFFIPLSAFETYDDGVNNGVYSFGTIVFSCMFITMEARCLFITKTWNKYTIAGIMLSLFWYFLFLTLYGGVVCLVMSAPAPYFYMVPYHMMQQSSFWVLTFMTTSVSVLFTLLFEYARREFRPNFIDLCMEFSRKDFHGASVLLPSRLRRFVQKLRKVPHLDSRKSVDVNELYYHQRVSEQVNKTVPRIKALRGEPKKAIKSPRNQLKFSDLSFDLNTATKIDSSSTSSRENCTNENDETIPSTPSTILDVLDRNDTGTVGATPGAIDSGRVVRDHLRSTAMGGDASEESKSTDDFRSTEKGKVHVIVDDKSIGSASEQFPCENRPDPTRWFLQQR
eukprot:g5143.t1